MSLSDFDLLAMLPRAPEKRSTSELLVRVGAAGHRLTARSLQRRLVSLSSSHPILCDDRSKPYGWSISAHAPRILGDMSMQEAVTLKLAQRYLREVIPADLLDDLRHYFNQADAKLKDESLYRAWLGKVRMIPASQPLRKPAVSRHVLTNAYSGVLRGMVLNVTYRGRDEDKAKSYDIEPLAIVVRGHMTYLVAQFPWSDDEKLMALHRFSAIKLTEKKTRGRLAFDLDQFIESGKMGFLATAAQKVHARFYDGAGLHLEETPVSATQALTTHAGGVTDLFVTLPVTEQFKWWLLGFGDRVEVIAPAALRKEFHARLISAERRYRETGST